MSVIGLGEKSNHTHVFPNDLLQSMAQDLPRENLHVLLDIAGLRCWEPHDDLEEFLTVRLSLGNSKWSETLQVSPNSILLFHSEPHPNQRFEKVNGIDARHKALVFIVPVDAADADAVRSALLGSNGRKVCMDGAAMLVAAELYQTPFGIMLILTPALGHRVKVAI